MDNEPHSHAAISEIAVRYGLTEREQQTLSGICSGLSNKELAARMKISPNTVKAFVHIIMLKMGVATRGEIAARIEDLISQPPQNAMSPSPHRARVAPGLARPRRGT
ncbi:MAG TPA: LuxR C-terminal-related transcriptional regulator [Bryobacteraceae bacterium]|nr:LuxR C-terminal-related transcriptional regulator [Bryobacteraceae bacterium]